MKRRSFLKVLGASATVPTFERPRDRFPDTPEPRMKLFAENQRLRVNPPVIVDDCAQKFIPSLYAEKILLKYYKHTVIPGMFK